MDSVGSKCWVGLLLKPLGLELIMHTKCYSRLRMQQSRLEGWMSIMLAVAWVAVKELKLSYHNGYIE